MEKETQVSGSNRKLSGKVVYLRKSISILIKTKDKKEALRIPKDTVGILTGGFVNKRINGQVETFLDVKIILFSHCSEFSKKHTMLVSVALKDLKFNSDSSIN